MSNHEGTAERLDRIMTLLEDLIILQALQAQVKGEAVRKILRVDMNRVTKVSKMLKSAKTR